MKTIQTISTSNVSTLTELSDEQLANTTGGGVGGILKGVAKFGAKKVPLVGWAASGYFGVKGYKDSRAEGHGVGRSVLEGAKDAII